MGCAQEWNCGLGNKLPELSQRLLGGPLHCMQGRWFPKLPPHWNVLGLVKTQVFIAAWAYTALLRRLPGCEVLFHQAPGALWTCIWRCLIWVCHSLAVQRWVSSWVSLSLGILLYKMGITINGEDSVKFGPCLPWDQLLRTVMCPGSPQPDSALVSPGEGEGCTSLTPSVKPGLDSLFCSTNMTDLCLVQTML